MLAVSTAFLPSVGFSNEVTQLGYKLERLQSALDEVNSENTVENKQSPLNSLSPKGKEAIGALMGKWFLSYTYDSQHNDTFVINSTFTSSDGQIAGTGLFYPDQVGNGIFLVCLDIDVSSYFCSSENENQEVISFIFTTSGNNITSGFLGKGATADIAPEDLESFNYPVTGHREVNTGAEANYDNSKNELIIPVVNYEGSKYRVILQNSGNFVFMIKDVQPTN